VSNRKLIALQPPIRSVVITYECAAIQRRRRDFRDESKLIRFRERIKAPSSAEVQRGN
jgi:hypothetical protein